MKQSSKERLATLLMDELLERLSERESIRELLGDMTSLPIDEVIRQVLADFEQAVRAFHENQSRSRSEIPEKRTETADDVALQGVAEVTGVMHESSAEGPDAVGEVRPEVAIQEPPASIEPALTAPPLEDPGESVSPVELVEGETRSSKRTVQLDPIRLEFPKINLKLDLHGGPDQSGEQKNTTSVKKTARPDAKRESPPPQIAGHQEDSTAENIPPAAEQPVSAKQPSRTEARQIPAPARGAEQKAELPAAVEQPVLSKKPVLPETRQEDSVPRIIDHPAKHASEKRPAPAEQPVPAKKPVRSETKEETPRQVPGEKDESRTSTHSAPAGQEHSVSVKKPARSEPREEASRQQKSDDREKELQRLEELARKIEEEYEVRRSRLKDGKSEAPAPVEKETVPPRESLKPEQTELVESSTFEPEDEVASIEPVGSGKHVAHARYTFSDDEHVYVHAVSRIPAGEEPSPDPFMLEEKGIDGRGFAFALDYGNMRFFLSKINPNEVNISRSMVLLLNKQESLQMQGVHESTLNDLRAHGILLPMEFGTVARGKDYLLGLIDKNKEDLEDALDELEKTTWWTVTASMLDSTIAGVVGTDVQRVGRERPRDRASYMSIPPGKKFDIKVLERILQREKKIAEAIHAELSKIVDRSDVEAIIGLGSGSSEDWKVILKASYEVPPKDLPHFSRAVTDLQYHHLQYDLMIALTGDKDCLALRRK